MSQAYKFGIIFFKQNFVAMKKAILIVLSIATLLLIINQGSPFNSWVGSLSTSLYWLIFTIMIIFNLQFVIHELGHIFAFEYDEKRRWLIEYQGPFGAMVVPSFDTSLSKNEALKSLKAPYLGLSSIIIYLLSIFQILITIKIASLIHSPWIMYSFITLIWFYFLVNFAVSVILVLWRIKKPSKIGKVVRMLGIFVGTDILLIAHYEGIQVPEEMGKHLDSEDFKNLYDVMIKSTQNGSYSKLFEDNRITYVRKNKQVINE